MGPSTNCDWPQSLDLQTADSHAARGAPVRPPIPHTAMATRRPRHCSYPRGCGGAAVLAVTTRLEVEIREVEPGAVAVKMHHVIRPPSVIGGVQYLGQPLECGRAEHVQIQALHLIRSAAYQAASSRRNGTSRPPGRSPSSTRNRSPEGSGRSVCPAARKCVRTKAPAPSATGAPLAGSRISSHASPGASPGSAALPLPEPGPSGSAPAPKSPPHPGWRTHAGTILRPARASRASASRAISGAGSAGNSW